MKVLLAQINTTVGDFEGNFRLLEQAYKEALDQGVDLLIFPEQALPGYPAEDLLEREDFIASAESYEDRVVALTQGHSTAIILGNLTRRQQVDYGKPIYNSAILIEEGKVVGRQHKALLPTYDVFDEARYFEPGSAHQVLEFRGRKLGLAVCEDAWNEEGFWPERLYQRDPIQELAQAGADLLIVISASPYSIGRGLFRQEMLASLAKKHAVELIYCNLVGGNTTLVFDGESLIFDRKGQLIVQGKKFQEERISVDLSALPSPIEAVREGDALEAYRALVLGTQDYLGKTGFKKAVIGLSGGIDSTLVAVVAQEALGAENVIGVSMPSRYSSEGSKTDAELLAKNLGIQYLSLPIESIFSSALKTLEPAFKDLPEDVTEENLQARSRGLILMAMSNKLGALLLTTGNKSELAVGYCTLYGDMCGGLAVISDVPKILVYDMCRQINEVRGREVIPVSVIEKPPSAELRPDQVDQDSLPEYEVLDDILFNYVEKGKSPDEIIDLGYDPETVERMLRLVNLNEYKRQQAAPGIRITTKAFGPGRKFPIVQRFPTRRKDIPET